MSVVAYNRSQDMTSYRSNVPQQTDPLEHLYNLERAMDDAERRTASMIDDLADRLDKLEMKVSSVSDGLNVVSRDLEQKVVTLAQRVNAMTDDA